jgi:hypothetical protein
MSSCWPRIRTPGYLVNENPASVCLLGGPWSIGPARTANRSFRIPRNVFTKVCPIPPTRSDVSKLNLMRIASSHGRDDKIHLWELPLDVAESQETSLDPNPLEIKPVWSLEVNSLNYCGFSWEPSRHLISFPSLTDSNLVRLPGSCDLTPY